jgi:hypothetical protein
MFGRRQPTTVGDVDAAFDKNEADVRMLGETVAARIATEFRAGRINRHGVQERVALAISQLRSLPADDVPESMCRLLEQTLRETIAKGLIVAGIPGAEVSP